MKYLVEEWKNMAESQRSGLDTEGSRVSGEGEVNVGEGSQESVWNPLGRSHFNAWRVWDLVLLLSLSSGKTQNSLVPFFPSGQ